MEGIKNVWKNRMERIKKIMNTSFQYIVFSIKFVTHFDYLSPLHLITKSIKRIPNVIFQCAGVVIVFLRNADNYVRLINFLKQDGTEWLMKKFKNNAYELSTASLILMLHVWDESRDELIKFGSYTPFLQKFSNLIFNWESYFKFWIFKRLTSILSKYANGFPFIHKFIQLFGIIIFILLIQKYIISYLPHFLICYLGASSISVVITMIRWWVVRKNS